MKQISRKRLILLLLISLLSVNIYANSSEISLYINGKSVKTSVNPVKDASGSMLVPLKVIANELGADVKYDSKEKTIMIVKEKTIKLTIGSKQALIDGQPYTLAVEPKIIDGTTMIPIRFVATALDCEITGDYIHNRVTISTTNNLIKSDTKNMYTPEYLQQLVDKTECSKEVLEFRNTNNPRRNGLLKQEGKYFDIYYPANDLYAKQVVEFLTPHMDKVYMMLTDLYGIQAKVEVHLIDGVTGRNEMSSEGEIRNKENVTFVWLEEENDKGGNNLSELVHEINHNFFNQANNRTGNQTLWLDEANAKLIPSLYISKNYDGKTDMWSFYERLVVSNIGIKTADEYLNGSKTGDAWSQKEEGSIERQAQIYGLALWSYMYNQAEDLDTFKYYLRNMNVGNGDTLLTLQKFLNKSIDEVEKDFLDF